MIGFLQPLALLGLAAAGIPALLHLLQRRQPPTVPFPPVRYLSEAERRHSRRLRLRNLLLLILRTAVIVLVVLAAARPVARVPLGDSHAPSAVAVVVDNSMSAGAIADGRAVVADLARRAERVAGAAAPGDRLWLVLADGVPRRVSPMEAMTALGALEAEPRRLDLGEAVRAAARVVADDPLPGAVVVVSDLQAPAVTSGEALPVPATFWRPDPPPANRWVDSARAVPPVWTPEGRVVLRVGGAGTDRAEVRLERDGRTLARALAAPGDEAVLAARLPGSGWHALRLVLAPDELRDDDVYHLAVRAAAPTPVTVAGQTGPFVADAIGVLIAAGRATEGNAVAVGDAVRPGRQVLLPPADPVLAGAVNRALAARGVSWRYGAVESGEWLLRGGPLMDPGEAAVHRRYRLAGSGPVLLTAGGEPWMVQAGDMVLLASRLDPGWTDLPVTAGFVPLLDQVLNRIAAGDAWHLHAAPGATVTYPPAATALLGPPGRIPVPADRRGAAPGTPGVYYLAGAAGDTVGALAVNHDPRESDLTAADASALRAAFGPRTRLADGADVVQGAFAGADRADLAGLLLLLALAVALAEFAVGSITGRGRTD